MSVVYTNMLVLWVKLTVTVIEANWACHHTLTIIYLAEEHHVNLPIKTQVVQKMCPVAYPML